MQFLADDAFSTALCRECADCLDNFNRFCQRIELRQKTLQNEFLAMKCFNDDDDDDDLDNGSTENIMEEQLDIKNVFVEATCLLETEDDDEVMDNNEEFAYAADSCTDTDIGKNLNNVTTN